LKKAGVECVPIIDQTRPTTNKNAIMAGFAQTLTAQDIANLAAYYSAQPSVLSSKY